MADDSKDVPLLQRIDTLLNIGCIFAAIPLGFLFRRVSDVKLRYRLSYAVGLLFSVLVYKWNTVQYVLVAAAVYAVCKVSALRSRVHLLAWFITFGTLLCGKYYMMMYRFLDWALDFTGPLMLMALRIIAFAYNYRDGLMSDKEKPAGDAKSGAVRVWQRQREYALEKLPSVEEYLGYVFFFGTYLVGPFFEYKEYREFIESKEHRVAPGWHIAKMTLLGVAFLVPAGLHDSMAIDYFGTDGLAEFLAKPLYTRLLLVYLSCLFFRSRFYAAWPLAEAGCHAAGFGTRIARSDDGKEVVKYDLLRNVRAIEMELSPSTKDCVGVYWNILTARFLKQYAFTRLYSVPTLRPWAKLLTFSISALWHGFYPGYLIFFCLVYFCETCHEKFRETVGPMFGGANSRQFYIISWLGTMATFTASQGFFTAMLPARVVGVYSGVFWIPQLAICFMGIVGFGLAATRTPTTPAAATLATNDANNNTNKTT